MRKTTQCVVCGDPISPEDVRRFRKTCRRVPCRNKYWVDELARQRESRRRQQEREDKLFQMMYAIRDKQAAALGVDDADSYTPFAISACTYELDHLPDERREAFEDHLRELVSQAFDEVAERGFPAEPEEAAEENSDFQDPLPVLGGSCATCEGSCCSDGETHAFVTVDTVKRFLKAHSDAMPDDVMVAYTSRIPEATFRDSCVFHTPSGCNLPRHLRSDMCNQWECHRLKDLRKLLREQPDARVFVGALVDGQIPRSSFLSTTKRGMTQK